MSIGTIVILIICLFVFIGWISDVADNLRRSEIQKREWKESSEISKAERQKIMNEMGMDETEAEVHRIMRMMNQNQNQKR